MKLTVIGCTGSMSGPAGPASSYLLEAAGADGRTHAILLDLGPGAFGALMNVRDPRELDAVVLSHLHADHMVDMIGFHVFRRWHPSGALGPIDVLAPSGARERVRGVGGDGPEEDYAGEFTFHEHDPARAFEVGPFRVESFPVRHPVEAYAVRVTGPREDGTGTAVLTFSGDTDECDGLIAAARDADLFLCEAAFVDGRDTSVGVHLTGARAGQAAATAGARAVILTHIQPWTDPAAVVAPAEAAYGAPVALARPGLVVAL